MSTDDRDGPGKRPDWWPWVRRQMIEQWGRENIAKLARDGDFDRSNVYRWQKGGDVEPWLVGVVADVFGANPIDAFIAAGFFTQEQFDEYRSRGVESAPEVTNEALAAEVLRRMHGGFPQGRPPALDSSYHRPLVRPQPDEEDDDGDDLSEHEQALVKRGERTPTGRKDPRRSRTSS